MARRTREESSSTQTEAPAEVPTQAEEATVTETVIETAPEAPAEDVQESAGEPAAEKPADKPVDLTAFNEAVQAAVDSRDEATGEVPEGPLNTAQGAYRALDGVKAKNAAKKAVEEKMREAMNARDLNLARAFMLVSDNLTAGPAGAKEKVPADPTEAFVQRVAGLRLAATLVERGEGVAEDADSKIEALVSESAQPASAYLAWLQADEATRGDEPQVSAVVKAAVKLAQGKAARVGGGSSGTRQPFTGERRDIGKHISEAFQEVEPGTFLTVAEIRKYASSEYGSGEASAGAISARLFPSSGKCTVEGIEPGQNEKGNKGATKVA